MPKWNELEPDPGMLEALSRAGTKPDDTDLRKVKQKWSKGFADSCALMLANAIRESSKFKRHAVFPTPDGKKGEYVTAAGRRGKGKKVDVAVSTMTAGLEVALTLKGGNFLDPDGSSGYGKNLTGRLYELLDETKAVHEYHPHAQVVCVYFLPLQASQDKKVKSTFAHAVALLRGHTGRDDELQVTQFDRFDWSVVCLYVSGELDGGPPHGACRYFDVMSAPPKRGRPPIKSTMDAKGFVHRVYELHRTGRVVDIEYGEAEEDD